MFKKKERVFAEIISNEDGLFFTFRSTPYLKEEKYSTHNIYYFSGDGYFYYQYNILKKSYETFKIPLWNLKHVELTPKEDAWILFDLTLTLEDKLEVSFTTVDKIEIRFCDEDLLLGRSKDQEAAKREVLEVWETVSQIKNHMANFDEENVLPTDWSYKKQTRNNNPIKRSLRKKLHKRARKTWNKALIREAESGLYTDDSGSQAMLRTHCLSCHANVINVTSGICPYCRNAV